MAKVQKENCIAVTHAQAELGISRTTMYHYINDLRIERRRFPFDRVTYITLDDYKRLREFKETKQL